MNAASPDPACSIVTRRRFLAGLGATAATVVVGGYAISIYGKRDGSGAALGNPSVTGAGAGGTTPAVPTAATGRTLVVIEMGGGNDGLNTVVPHSLGAYHDLRTDLAVTDSIDLDGEIGLHPNLPYLAELYAEGDLAVIEGVGYPDPDLSHFTSMMTWWSAGATIGTGWLGRYLDLTAGRDNPLAAIVIGPGPNPAVLGSESFAVTIQDATGLRPQLPEWVDTGDELLGMWSGFAPSPIDSPGLLGQVHQAIADSTRAATSLDAVLADVFVPESNQNQAGRRGDLVDYLTLAAALTNSDLAPQVIYVHGFGDFDTHDNQAGRHADLMTELNDGIQAFFTGVQDPERVVVVTTSEFGRRAASNGRGTDHGTASSQFVIGSPVAGGRYGLPVDLKRLDARGNPIHTIDFRSTYATVLDRWLGVDHPAVLDADHEVLPLL